MEESEAIRELHKIRPRGGIIPQKRAEALDVAIQALEKQIPKKPIYESKMPRCPSCRSWIQNNESIQKYCNFCGQALDWDE